MKYKGITTHTRATICYDMLRCRTYNNNKDLVKIFLNIGVQIRQLRNLLPMNLVVVINTLMRLSIRWKRVK